VPLGIDILVTAPLETNTYVLRAGGECWVVDPGLSGELMGLLGRQAPPPTRILLTHGHGDHIAGVGELKAAFAGILLCCPAADAEMLTDAEKNLSAPFGFDITADMPNELVQPGQTLAMGELTWKVLDTSGHSPGGVSYYCAGAGVVLVGDALFAGSIGRTDIPGASEAVLLANIKSNLLSLPEETRVLPGHGPATTIGREKRTNPFLVGIVGRDGTAGRGAPHGGAC